MKKIISVFLVLIVLVMFSVTVYAAKGAATVPDQPVPGAPARSVDTETYDEQNNEIEVNDNIVPGGPAKSGSAKTTDIKGDVIPQTGGIPAETFYAAGGLMVAAALVLTFKKAAKN